MTSPSSRRRSLRVRRGRPELILRLPLPSTPALPASVARELVVIASRSTPYLRSLTVYRSPSGGRDEPPRAA